MPGSVPAPIPPAAGVASWALSRGEGPQTSRGRRRAARSDADRRRCAPVRQQPRKIPLAFSFGLTSSKHFFFTTRWPGDTGVISGAGSGCPQTMREEYHQPGAESFNEPALHCQTRLSPPRPSCPAPRPTSRLAASDRNSLGDSHVGQVEVVLPSRLRRGRSPSGRRSSYQSSLNVPVALRELQGEKSGASRHSVQTPSSRLIA